MACMRSLVFADIWKLERVGAISKGGLPKHVWIASILSSIGAEIVRKTLAGKREQYTD